ncbi:response regulator, partial [Gammaproteobacteria bacterium]|nr:response regulator [Gammaproteobacteria bacterium]
NNSLQEGLISSQMVPFAGIVPRLRRLSRQVSTELGKQVTIKFSNPEGKIDRSVLQVMVNPLEHMIRNAIDHGVETPKERLRKAKPEQAEIIVKLYRQGANIVLDISDDGAGIDVAAIRRQAVSRGLLAKDVKISDQEAYQFILQAGFSTSEEVSKISGRGVGMDVVYNEIKQIGGDIEIFSTQGVGSTFSIRLPFTSSLNRALLFELNKVSYAILLNTIDGIVLESKQNMETYYDQTEIPVVEYSDKAYELAYMGSMLDENSKPKLNTIERSAPLLLISGKEKNMALQVDSIVGSRDFVVKSLGSQFSTIQGLSGAVILGDGSVVMVLDPLALVDNYAVEKGVLLQTVSTAIPGQGADEPRAVKTVLVVDDSITVRKVTSIILKRNGMNVILAKNGVDAVEILQNTVPDVMLLDIEMPKMDGFEVASYVRRQENAVKDLPIIMITSRIGDKHRTRAEEIGVNQYMCKPFQEENLLEAIAEYN